MSEVQNPMVRLGSMSNDCRPSGHVRFRKMNFQGKPASDFGTLLVQLLISLVVCMHEEETIRLIEVETTLQKFEVRQWNA